MEAQTNKQIALIDDYQITYEQLQDSTLNIYVCSQGTFSKYAKKNVKFNSINLKGFEMAIKRQAKQFKIEIYQHEKNDMQEESSLQIKISFSSSFLNSVSETITVPFKSKISQIQLFKSKAEAIQSKLKVLKTQNKYETLAYSVEDKDFKSNGRPHNEEYYDQQNYNELQADADYDMKEFENIRLPEEVGRFKVELSMVLKCPSTYFYLYTDRVNYQGPFPSGAMTLPSNSQFVPFKMAFIVDNRHSGIKIFPLYAYDIADYPFKASNIVISVTRMQ